MVVALGPGKFYGNSLPRPRFYTDVKFNDTRVDPPVSVLDPLLEWANEAHWSMGGLSLKRLRLQGRIEGNVDKLRKEQEKFFKNKSPILTPTVESKRNKGRKGGVRVDSPQPAPVPRKLKLRSRVVKMDGDENGDEDEEEVLGNMVKGKKRRLVRKLGDDFELVAGDLGKSKRVLEDGGPRTRRRAMVLNEDEDDDISVNVENAVVSTKGVSNKSGRKGSVSPNGNRSSPRLKKKSG